MKRENTDGAEEEVLSLLRAGQILLVKYPMAARAAVRALVAEGRRFAETDEGRALRARLARSPMVGRARLVWEGATLNMLEDQDDQALLPSVLLEAVMAAAASNRLEALLSELFVEGGPNVGPKNS